QLRRVEIPPVRTTELFKFPLEKRHQRGHCGEALSREGTVLGITFRRSDDGIEPLPARGTGRRPQIVYSWGDRHILKRYLTICYLVRSDATAPGNRNANPCHAPVMMVDWWPGLCWTDG